MNTLNTLTSIIKSAKAIYEADNSSSYYDRVIKLTSIVCLAQEGYQFKCIIGDVEYRLAYDDDLSVISIYSVKDSSILECDIPLNKVPLVDGGIYKWERVK